MAPTISQVRCLLSSVKFFNVSRGGNLANVTWNKLQLKSGETFDEIISDYGRGLVNKSEVYANRIIDTGTNGHITTYTRKPLGQTVVSQANGFTIIVEGSLFDKIHDTLYRGLF